VFQGPEIIPPAPAPAHGHGDEPHAHAAASTSAIETGTAASSGVDVGQTTHAPAKHEDAHGGDAHGADAHGHGGHHNHEPMLMIVPLILLAIGAIVAGYLNWPEREHNLADFLGQSPSFRIGFEMARMRFDATTTDPEARPVESNWGQELRNAAGERIPEHTGTPFTPIMAVSALIALAGIGCAYWFHLRNRPAGERLPQRFPVLNRLLEHKYWVDEIYQAGIIEPLRRLGVSLFTIDKFFVDGMVDLVGVILPQGTGAALKRATQRGYLQGYALTMLFGVAVIVLVVFW